MDTWWSRKVSSYQTAQGAVLLSQYIDTLLELKIVLSADDDKCFENFAFTISQYFHRARIKMYCMPLFLQLHFCPISIKYRADLSFKSLTLLEWKYLNALTSFLLLSRYNYSFLISKTPLICFAMSSLYSKHSPLQVAYISSPSCQTRGCHRQITCWLFGLIPITARQSPTST